MKITTLGSSVTLVALSKKVTISWALYLVTVQELCTISTYTCGINIHIVDDREPVASDNLSIYQQSTCSSCLKEGRIK